MSRDGELNNEIKTKVTQQQETILTKIKMEYKERKGEKNLEKIKTDTQN